MNTGDQLQKRQIVFASRNAGKIREVTQLLGPDFLVLSLDDIGFKAIIPEPHETFAKNARQKAKDVYDFYKGPVVADDSGLSVAALKGAPGVWSARFAGEGASDHDNVSKLLEAMSGITDRSASFVCVLCLIHEGVEHFFEGRCNGTITSEPSGGQGFGYDPIFIPSGYHQTFGTLDQAVKSAVSHRAKAFRQLRSYLDAKPIATS